MEISWLQEWFADPGHQLELMMGAVCVVMWILARYLGVANDDFQGYWEQRDDSVFDED